MTCFLSIGDYMELMNEDGAECFMGFSVVCRYRSLAETDGLGTGGSVPFLVVGLFGDETV